MAQRVPIKPQGGSRRQSYQPDSTVEVVEPSPQKNEEVDLIDEHKRILFFGLPFTFTHYSLTSKRLSLKVGFFNTTEDEILLYRIKDHTLKRSFWQKVFRIGTVHVVSTDEKHKELDLKNIKNFREFRDLIAKGIETERLRMRVRAGEFLEGVSDNYFEDFD